MIIDDEPARDQNSEETAELAKPRPDGTEDKRTPGKTGVPGAVRSSGDTRR